VENDSGLFLNFFPHVFQAEAWQMLAHGKTTACVFALQ